MYHIPRQRDAALWPNRRLAAGDWPAYSARTPPSFPVAPAISEDVTISQKDDAALARLHSRLAESTSVISTDRTSKRRAADGPSRRQRWRSAAGKRLGEDRAVRRLPPRRTAARSRSRSRALVGEGSHEFDLALREKGRASVAARTKTPITFVFTQERDREVSRGSRPGAGPSVNR